MPYDSYPKKGKKGGSRKKRPKGSRPSYVTTAIGSVAALLLLSGCASQCEKPTPLPKELTEPPPEPDWFILELEKIFRPTSPDPISGLKSPWSPKKPHA